MHERFLLVPVLLLCSASACSSSRVAGADDVPAIGDGGACSAPCSEDAAGAQAGTSDDASGCASCSPVPLLRVRTAATAYVDSQGAAWAPDEGFTTGVDYEKDDSITKTVDPTLYQTSRWSPEGAVRYAFHASVDGTYAVTLRFAEKFFSAPGERRFDIALNGVAVESGFDIFAAAGGKDAAVDRTYAVQVSGGSITIALSPVLDHPDVSALEIDGPAGSVVAVAGTAGGDGGSAGTVCGTAPAPVPYTPVSGYATSWIANSLPGGAFAWAGGRYVQPQITDIAVTAAGRVFAANYYDEGTMLNGMYQLEAGAPASLGSAACISATGGGGHAATTNGAYVFMTYEDCGGRTGVLRYAPDGSAAAWSGGANVGGISCGNLLIVDGSAGPCVSSALGGAIFGLAASSTELYVSDGAADQIAVYDIASMSLVRTFPFTSPRRIAYDANTDSLWIGQGGAQSSFAGHVQHLSKTGTPLPETIADVAVPTALAMKGASLWVGDSGPDMQIKIYDASGKRTGTFGAQGGYLGAAPGCLGDDRLYFPLGIGFDATGDVYVAGGLVSLNSYVGGLTFPADQPYQSDLRVFDPSGHLLWSLRGQGFVDTAAADPATDGVDVYTAAEHYRMDYSRSNGREWSWYAATIDPVHYPEDTRLFGDAYATQVQNVGGGKYLVTTGMGPDYWAIHRMSGEIAVPDVVFAEWSDRIAGWASGLVPQNCGYMWVDANDNGAPDAGELQCAPFDFGTQDYDLDSAGDVWTVNEGSTVKGGGITVFHLAGKTPAGGLSYSPTDVTAYGIPSPFYVVENAKYLQSSDTLYVSGYTPSRPCAGYSAGSPDHCISPYMNHCAGSALAAYPHWSAGNRTAAYTIDLPYFKSDGAAYYDGSSNDAVTIKPWTVAEPKIFAGIFQTQFTSGCPSGCATGNIVVYDAGSGATLGKMYPGAEVDHYMGWLDSYKTVQAFRRSNGEYLLFEEEEIDGKVNLLRGLLNDFTQY